ncbi:hypothetical protein HMPREF9413_0498 [Paenibacillus sp. HGF7]|nr:hypothetical protein HMPREF9413_0498 [Paenibacillus sp. HGF7]
MINKLYASLEQRSVTDEDKLKLKEIKNMHDEITQALELEKKTLEKQIVAIEKRKTLQMFILNKHLTSMMLFLWILKTKSEGVAL